MARRTGEQFDTLRSELATALCAKTAGFKATGEPCENCTRTALLVLLYRDTVADFLRRLT